MERRLLFAGFRLDAVLYARRTFHILAKFLAGARKDGADAVDWDVHGGADFFVAAAFQIVKPHDLAFTAGKFAKGFLDFFEVFQPESRLRGFVLFGFGLCPPLMRGFKFARGSTTGQFMHANPPRDDGEIGSEAALIAKLAKN